MIRSKHTPVTSSCARIRHTSYRKDVVMDTTPEITFSRSTTVNAGDPFKDAIEVNEEWFWLNRIEYTDEDELIAVYSKEKQTEQ